MGAPAGSSVYGVMRAEHELSVERMIPVRKSARVLPLSGDVIPTRASSHSSPRCSRPPDQPQREITVQLMRAKLLCTPLTVSVALVASVSAQRAKSARRLQIHPFEPGLLTPELVAFTPRDAIIPRDSHFGREQAARRSSPTPTRAVQGPHLATGGGGRRGGARTKECADPPPI